MNQNILSIEEKQAIESLNIRQIINQFPDLVIKVKRASKSYVDMMVQLGISATNTSAKKSIKHFLEDQGEELLNYRIYQYSNSYSKNTKLSKEEVLQRFVADSPHIGTQLRKWVIAHDLLPYHCSVTDCMLSLEDKLIWNGKQITLDLDHINGDNTDNRLENLRWLCPNCHSQTETYKGKNKRIKGKPNVGKDLEARRAAYEALPDANALWNEIKKNGFASTSRKYNVPKHGLKIKLGGYIGDDETINKIVESVLKKGFHPDERYLQTKTKENIENRSGDETNKLGKNKETGAKQNYLAPPKQKAAYPPVDVLTARVVSEGYESLARELGVSGNAIRKYLKNRLGYAPKRGEVSP